MIAQYASTCVGCGRRTYEGDEVATFEGQWMHAVCARAAARPVSICSRCQMTTPCDCEPETISTIERLVTESMPPMPPSGETVLAQLIEAMNAIDALVAERERVENNLRRVVALAAIRGCGVAFQLSTGEAYVASLVPAGEAVIVP